MKLVIAVVQGSDADPILDALTASGHRATQVSSAGGYLRESNVTLLIAVEAEVVSEVLSIVDENSTARKRFVNPLMPFAPTLASDNGADDGIRVGANVFVLNISRFVRLTG